MRSEELIKKNTVIDSDTELHITEIRTYLIRFQAKLNYIRSLIKPQTGPSLDNKLEVIDGLNFVNIYILTNALMTVYDKSCSTTKFKILTVSAQIRTLTEIVCLSKDIKSLTYASMTPITDLEVKHNLFKLSDLLLSLDDRPQNRRIY